nr:MAG TPA: hypothetical protein [Caudoviricetes sp.]
MSECQAARACRQMRSTKAAVDRMIRGAAKVDRKRLKELKNYERLPDQGDKLLLYLERERERRARYLREHSANREGDRNVSAKN